MSLTAALLLGASPDLSTSPLVAPDHEYEWVVLENEGQTWLHWDRNSIERREFAEGEFPVLLIRMQTVPKPYPSGRVDTLIAVDCARNQTATIEASQQISKEAYEPGEYHWNHDKLEFGEFAEQDANRKETQEMMIAVCGKDWSL
jgi:hypothetical protein